MSDELNKRIVKNTLLLYVRMIVLLVIQLYTSRIVLQALGIEDFGIYNVVGGIVTMFTFLNAAMNSSSQRYITFYLGKGDKTKSQKVFSTCLFIHILITAFIFILSETIGLWFLYNKIVIPETRFTAAFWVFQFSVFSTLIMVLSTPYNATIIAHEKMSAFAYISIVDAILKLFIVFLLLFTTADKLILYAVLLALTQILIQIIYVWYCKSLFKETKIVYNIDMLLFKSMLSFMGWNVWGGISQVLYSQGVNILLNMFFGPVVNAARGIAIQVQSVVFNFCRNFQTAVNPQITISYAKNDLKTMHNLIFKSSRYTFFLILIISLPIFIETQQLLDLWLSDTPEWTVSFVRLMLGISIVDSVANPLMISSAATGKVKLYQTVIGGTMLLIVPISYMFLKLGFNPNYVFYVHFVFCCITFVLRLLIVRPLISLSLMEFLKKVIQPCVITGVMSLLIPMVLFFLLNNTIVNVFIVIIVSVISSIISIYVCGVTNDEKIIVKNKIFILLVRIKKSMSLKMTCFDKS